MNNINKLTPEEMQIRCAEKCGWRDAQVFGDYSLGLHKIDSFPFEEIDEIPDYQHNRNALQELIEAVPEDTRVAFITKIEENLFGGYYIAYSFSRKYALLTADPLSIMRAFLEVMEAE